MEAALKSMHAQTQRMREVRVPQQTQQPKLSQVMFQRSVAVAREHHGAEEADGSWHAEEDHARSAEGFTERFVTI